MFYVLVIFNVLQVVIFLIYRISYHLLKFSLSAVFKYIVWFFAAKSISFPTGILSDKMS